MSISTNYKIYANGRNDGQRETVEFALLPNLSISKIFSFSFYTIYSNHNYNKLWSVGLNDHGQCAIHPSLNDDDDQINKITEITYFKENNIEIKQIFNSIASE